MPNSSLSIPSVCAIVVTYEPDYDRLQQVLATLGRQTQEVLIVDNGSRDRARLLTVVQSQANIRLLPLGENRGVGHALNAGIEKAIEDGYEFVLLMDQDSIPADNMVNMLVASYRTLTHAGKRVAAIGPRQQDSTSGRLSQHLRFAPWSIAHVPCPEDSSPVWVDFLITSGSLIPASAVREVGEMDGGLFIDHVDTEWTMRAQSKGFEVYGDCAAVMEHSLGEYRKKFRFLRHREVPIHKPFRYYYIFRNSVSLYRRAYTPWAWRRVDLVRLTQTIVFMTLFHPHRGRALRMMFRGISDGLRGVNGKLD